jgi:predicted amidohydrolase YtcJ
MADAQELQLAVHAIGDEANHLLLDAYEAAKERNGFRDARHRVEHAQHLLVADIPRFHRLKVVASMQPFHKADDGRYAEKAIGKSRLDGSYAYRQLLDSGALVCFGSDWPVVTLNPFAGVASAVNALILSGEVWLPSHSISVEEALRAYTLSPAKAIHQEHRLGTLEVGKLADIVVLADDPFALPPVRLGEVRVAMTIVAGKVVYDRAQESG